MSACSHDRAQRYGTTKAGEQRYRCRDCGKTFVESTRALDGMRIGTGLAAQIIRCTMEGVGIRATARLCGVSKDTILDLLALVGQRCKLYSEENIVNVAVSEVQADELWSFVYCKERTRKRLSLPLATFGDQYCYIGIERHHKLALAWHLANRDADETERFIVKLARACGVQPFQLSTDGWMPYKPAIRRNMAQVDYGMIIKLYGPSQETTRYSPPQIIEIKRRAVMGQPDIEKLCTSHAERHNLTVRMQLRRFTRLTNGFSRKFANHEAAIGLYFAHYNFVQRHGTLKTTPAVAAGIEARQWSVEELIERTMDYSPPPAPPKLPKPKTLSELVDRVLPDEDA